MPWGYQIWNSAGTKVIDSSESSLPVQSYPTLTTATAASTAVTYNLLGIGTSSINFHYNVRRFPSGTTRREKLFTGSVVGDSSTYNTNLPSTLEQLTTITVTNGASVIKDGDVTNWVADSATVSMLILLHVAI